jgi:fumarate reductase subunit D
MAGRFRKLYGASPLHLLALVASLLLGGAAIVGWFDSFPGPTALQVVAWFLGAIVAHDLVALPLYSLLDRIAFGSRGVRRAQLPRSAVAYVRVPALLSALLFLVFFPEILRLGDRNFFVASGLHQRVFLARYLLTCAALFGLSGVAYAISLRRAMARSQTPPSRAGSPRGRRTRALARLASAMRTRGGRRRAGTRRS